MPEQIHMRRRGEVTFRDTDRASGGARWSGVVVAEVYDPMLSRAIDGATARAAMPVAFDGESVTVRTPSGQEWQFGLDDLHEAINWPPGASVDAPTPL